MHKTNRLGNFAMISLEEKRKQIEALNQKVMECTFTTSMEHEDKTNKEVWRGKRTDMTDMIKRKNDTKEIISRYKKFKSEKSGEYTMKYLNHLSELLYRTQKIDYIAQRKDLVNETKKQQQQHKSKFALRKVDNDKSKTKDSGVGKRILKGSVCLTENSNYKKKVSERGLRNKRGGDGEDNRIEIQEKGYNDNDYDYNDNAKESITLISEKKEEDNSCIKEPDIQYEKDSYNYMKLLALKVSREYNDFYKPKTAIKKTMLKKRENRTSYGSNKIFGFRPENIDRLLEFSSIRTPAKNHFFKVLNLRKRNGDPYSPYTTAYTSFPNFPSNKSYRITSYTFLSSPNQPIV